jgi:hypothetical protein
MKTINYLPLLLSFFGAATAFGQTITWTAATNPHIVQGTYTVPAGQTLVMEPGVIVQIQPNSTLLVYGTVNANGTTTSHVTITGADNYSASIDARLQGHPALDLDRRRGNRLAYHSFLAT